MKKLKKCPVETEPVYRTSNKFEIVPVNNGFILRDTMNYCSGNVFVFQDAADLGKFIAEHFATTEGK